MKNKIALVVLSICLILSAQAHAIGNNRMRVKLKLDQLKNAERYAILTFNGNSVLTGGMGLGSLVSGALASKEKSGKLALDQKFYDNSYDFLMGALQSEGYNIVPVEEILSSTAYQEATTAEMPSFINAKGLKGINYKKKDTLQKIASEQKVNRLLAITAGYSIDVKGNIGNIAGKQYGVASFMIMVFDETGKDIGYIDASDVSTQAAGSVGGAMDPDKVFPMIDEASKAVVQKVAAEISKKATTK